MDCTWWSFDFTILPLKVTGKSPSPKTQGRQHSSICEPPRVAPPTVFEGCRCSNIFCCDLIWTSFGIKTSIYCQSSFEIQRNHTWTKKSWLWKASFHFLVEKSHFALICTSFLLPLLRFWSSSHTGSQAGQHVAGGNKISWVALRKVCAEPWRDVYLIPGYMAKTRELSQKIGGAPKIHSRSW